MVQLDLGVQYNIIESNVGQISEGVTREQTIHFIPIFSSVPTETGELPERGHCKIFKRLCEQIRSLSPFMFLNPDEFVDGSKNCFCTLRSLPQ